MSYKKNTQNYRHALNKSSMNLAKNVKRSKRNIRMVLLGNLRLKNSKKVQILNWPRNLGRSLRRQYHKYKIIMHPIDELNSKSLRKIEMKKEDNLCNKQISFKIRMQSCWKDHNLKENRQIIYVTAPA